MASYLGNTNDGVLCDHAFAVEKLYDFLSGDILFLTLTDPNHHVKNGRYQLVIEGNLVKTIGQGLTNTGLIVKSETTRALWRIKDFASDLLVLCLTPAKTVESIMFLPVSDPILSKALLLTLFFIRLHLYTVKAEDEVPAKTQVIFFWSSLLYVMHIDGVHHTTKKNWLLASISLFFWF